MKTSNQITIIGGGIIGLSCAHYLVQEGCQVTILEKETVGSGASHGNCGLLYFSDMIPLCAPGAVSHEMVRTICGTSPLYIKPEVDLSRLMWLLKFAAHCKHSHKTRAARDKYAFLEYSSHLFKELFDTTDLSCNRESVGILSVFASAKNWEGYAKTSRFVENFCPGYKRLTAAQALEIEPALRTDIAGAWHNTGDQHLRPDYLMTSWKAHLEAQGVIFMENCAVTDMCCSARKITALETDRGKVEGDTFILATGAWAPRLGQKLGLNIPVQPGKGYSITMARPENCPAVPCMLYERNMVVTPWKSGYRLGGTMEFSGYDLTLTRSRLDNLVQGAKAYMKHPVGDPVVEEWTSLRPMTFDDVPIVDRSPCQDNLIVATGHGMLGITLATGTGKLASDLILENKPAIDPKPFALGRF